MFINVELPWNVMIPAENMGKKGLELKRAILIRLLHVLASRKATEDEGYFVTLKNLEKIGQGRIRDNTGEILFPVVFSAITFKIFKGEILEGEVIHVQKGGVHLRCGPCEHIFLAYSNMLGYKFIPGEKPIFMNQNMSRIQLDSTVRFAVVFTSWNEIDREFLALASLEGDNLGPV